jgi:TolA-binding protein
MSKKGFILLLFAFLCGFALADVNLVPNPSFEEIKDNLPKGWSSFNSQKTSIDTVTYRSGKRSLCVFRTMSPDGKPISAGWESERIKIEANKEYIFEGWVKTDSATGDTYISLAFYEGDKFIREDLSEIISGDNNWRRLYLVSLPPPNADNLRIRFVSRGNSGTAYLDDVSLIPFLKKEYNINLAPNPSFEAGFENKPYDWEIAKEWGENAEQFRSTQYAHTGIYSLSVSVSSKGSRLAGWKSKGFPVFPGKLYTFTAWVKTLNASGETYLVIAWFNEKGWICNSYHGFFLTGNNDWTKLSVSDVPPKDATYAILYLRSDDNPGSAWFDDVKLNISDSLLSEIDVPNSSFEVDSDFWQPWLSEGHCREMKVDDTFAYEGKRSLMISDVSGTVAWQSRGMRLFSNEKYLYRLSCKVRTIGEGGKVSIWIAWFGEGGWIRNSESIPAPPNSDGWVELSLLARPPEEARSLEIYLGCHDFKGTAWFDDVRMEQIFFPIEERKIEIKEEVPLEYAIAKQFMGVWTVPPNRARESFNEAFPNEEDRREILNNLKEYLEKKGKPLEMEMRFFLGAMFFHLGDFEEAARRIDPDENISFDWLDVRQDMVLHYHFWAVDGLRKQEKEKKAKEIKVKVEMNKEAEPMKKAEILRQCGDDYWGIGMFKEARETYLKLLQTPGATLSPPDKAFLSYRIALSYFEEKNYNEASAKFSDFLSQYPNSDFAKEGKLYLAKSLRLSGKPKEAITYLKELWKEEIEENFRREVDKELGKCYMALRNDPSAVRDYRDFFKRISIPGALYIGSDTETLGDWLNCYGEAAFILCAMRNDTRDLTGGDLEPIYFAKREEAFLNDLDSDQIAYCRYTSDPAEPSRVNYKPAWSAGKPQQDSTVYLLDPISGTHINAYWDDRGEIYPPDYKGPDLFVDIVRIPEGVYRLALYMREHEVRITDDEGNLLAIKPRKEERGKEDVPNLYECFVIFGPIDITIHLVRDGSLCTVLSGIFLDKLEPPHPLPEIKTGKPETDEERLKIFEKAKDMYEEMRKKWNEDPYWYYQNLGRFDEIIRELQRYLSLSSDTTQAYLAQWMISQCYLQIPGKFKEAEEAEKKFTNMVTAK